MRFKPAADDLLEQVAIRMNLAPLIRRIPDQDLYQASAA
jgi:hypothetical protein